MATLNGDLYLEKQIMSIVSQSHLEWKLHIIDDYSDGLTKNIINKFISLYPEKIFLYKNPKKLGCHTKSFFYLLRNINLEKNSLIAYSDQDDIWFPNKLETAVKNIVKHDYQNQNILFFSEFELINSNGKHVKHKYPKKIKMGINNSIVQNIAGGNTMVFNSKLGECILKSNYHNVPLHDWWTYIIATAYNTKIISHRAPLIYYRQHENNVLGVNNSFFEKILRFFKMLSGDYKIINTIHLDSLSESPNLSSEIQNLLDDFNKIIHGNFFVRLKAYKRSRIFKNGFMSNTVFLLSVLIGKC